MIASLTGDAGASRVYGIYDMTDFRMLQSDPTTQFNYLGYFLVLHMSFILAVYNAH